MQLTIKPSIPLYKVSAFLRGRASTGAGIKWFETSVVFSFCRSYYRYSKNTKKRHVKEKLWLHFIKWKNVITKASITVSDKHRLTWSLIETKFDWWMLFPSSELCFDLNGALLSKHLNLFELMLYCTTTTMRKWRRMSQLWKTIHGQRPQNTQQGVSTSAKTQSILTGAIRI